MNPDTDSFPTPSNLARLLTTASAAGVVGSFREVFEKRWIPEPTSGQLWRIAHERHAEIAVVWDEKPMTTVAVIPAAEDTQFGDGSTVVLESSPLGDSLSVWPSLETTVPTWALDRCLGTVELGEITEARRSFRTQGARTARPYPQVKRWADSVRFRQELDARFEPFVSLTWLEERIEIEGVFTLGDLLKGRDLGLGWLADRVPDRKAGEILLLWQGKARLSPKEAGNLALSLEIDAQELRRLTCSTPPELRAQMGRPHYRPSVQAWAEQQRVTELEARERIEDHLLQLAARSTKESHGRWQELLDEFFRSELGPR